MTEEIYTDQREIEIHCKAFDQGYYKAQEQQIRFLREWLEMYSEGEARMLVCERDIFERIKELEKGSASVEEAKR